MPAPIESLDRPTLERRYRRMRLATGILGAVSLLLITALGTQSFRGADTGLDGNSANEVVDGPTTETQVENCPVVDRRDANDPRAVGAVDAPVVLHEWTDFRCPYCGAFSRDTLPVLLDEYVETGKVRLEIHDAALVGGDNSVLIAVATRAAGEQGLYFEYYDAIYQGFETRQDPKAEYSTDELIALAESVGVPDLAQFTEALSSEELHADVMRETAEAQKIGVTGVPFFSTSNCGQVTSGAQPIESFRQMLDAAVASATKK